MISFPSLTSATAVGDIFIHANWLRKEFGGYPETRVSVKHLKPAQKRGDGEMIVSVEGTERGQMDWKHFVM